MKKLVVTASFCLLSSTAMAASQISQLNVTGDVAIFTLETPKTHTVPGCVTAENQNKWAVSLSSLQGQALYSLLVTAVSKDKLVSVQSAQRCESVADVEQVQGLTLSKDDRLGDSTGTWLYKGDGATKVAKVVSYSDRGGYTYLPLEGTQSIKHYAPSITSSIHDLIFLDAECKGEFFKINYGHPLLAFYEYFDAYFTFADSSIKENRLWEYGSAPVYHYMGEQQGCVKQNYTANQESRAIKLEKTEHPLCGKTPCWIK
ncbi:hypothetical protein [Pseudoalteromonas ardens]|uniref:Uncharacterized protein n=1 Tax=Pseudoalteromonas rubra TaxID=43658 RepID=A0A0L0EPE0_9GAMM|nr:hypothetical protein [Pseudoalteromonas sp. R96]KNC66279.1 hypothetical protein AC626_17945 [Pseudoalteromonas rubra]MDK1312960.1 hypothetical protein [Pseudoalteromonas sp. R96]